MKKILKYSSVLLSILTLAACASSNQSSEGKGSSSKFEVNVKEGMYILPRDEDADEKYLALKVEVKNKGNKKITFSANDVTLYNADDEKIAPVNVYDSKTKMKFIEYGEKVSKGKSASGYVVYEVDPDEEYNLRFAPSLYDDLDPVDPKDEVSLKVDPSKYEDPTSEATEIMKEYINAVYLDGEDTGGVSNVSTSEIGGVVTFLADDKKSDDDSSKSDEKDGKSSKQSQLANDLKEDRNTFIKEFMKEVGEEFYNYQASDAELRTFAEAYIKENAKRAKINYTIKSYYEDYAVVYVRPETIDLANLDMRALSRKYYDENKDRYDNDYTEARKAADKFILENAPSQFESTPLDTQDNMNREGYEISMTKKKGKWKIDTSSENYELESLARAFRGGLY